ncbi:NADP-reducing hydrogenase subunit HndC [bacterium BMS3Bbin09]|nr:NADP-reducing hydrogenase subunit HndC [bacterium BMS3Bbin09]
MTEKDKKNPVKMEDVQAKADEKNCPVQRSLVFIEEFLAEPMCGKCFPCAMGSYETRIRVNKMIDGSASDEDIETVQTIMSHMLTASRCKKGKDTGTYILEQMKSADLRDHITGTCKTGECNAFTSYHIIPENCTMCGDCLEACKDNAIIGEKVKPFMSGYMPFEIAQKRCTKCGECIKVCKDNAVKTMKTKEMAEEPVGAYRDTPLPEIEQKFN